MSLAYRLHNVPGLFSEGVDPQDDAAPLRLRSARARLFGDGAGGRFARAARVMGALIVSGRVVALPAYLELMARDRAVGAAALPDPRSAMSRPDGYCGAASDLAPTTLLQAYSQGLHARAPLGPATWWSPPRRLLRDLRQPPTPDAAPAQFDLACDAIVAECARAAARRDALEAMTPALKTAHARLLDRGYAHAFRVEAACGYGVVVGRIFVVLGLSGSASAAVRAIDALDAALRGRRFATLDLSFVRNALPSGAGREVSRADYLDMLDANPEADSSARWL
jgi:Leu/Phe-tRNA-protein transferase